MSSSSPLHSSPNRLDATPDLTPPPALPIGLDDPPETNATPPPPKEESALAEYEIGLNDTADEEQAAAKQSFVNYIVPNRQNSDYKWQRARGVVGALEVHSEPRFNPEADMEPRYVANRKDVFADALQSWNELNLRQSFIEACRRLPQELCCCGLVVDEDATIKRFVDRLNNGWCKKANKVLQDKGFKVDCFVWNWQNAGGKAETNLLLIRFFELSSYRLRRASRDEKIDIEKVTAEFKELVEHASAEFKIEEDDKKPQPSMEMKRD